MNEIFRNKYFKHREINLASKTARLRSLSFLQTNSQGFYIFWKNAIATRLSLLFGQPSDFFLTRGQVGEQGRISCSKSFPSASFQCSMPHIYSRLVSFVTNFQPSAWSINFIDSSSRLLKSDTLSRK